MEAMRDAQNNKQGALRIYADVCILAMRQWGPGDSRRVRRFHTHPGSLSPNPSPRPPPPLSAVLAVVIKK